MTETHRAILFHEGAESSEIEVEDPVSLKSAQLFKFVSDAIWKQRPNNRGFDWASYSIGSVLEPSLALSIANEAASNIDPKLVSAGLERDLTLGGMRGEKVVIPSQKIAIPEATSIETFNWDKRFNTRQLGHNAEGGYDWVRFTDGHLDYGRELSVNFHFTLESHSRLVLRYSAQRYQYKQDEPTSLSGGVWFSGFAETGYEGNSLHSSELSEDQETAILTAMTQIGGISLEGFNTS